MSTVLCWGYTISIYCLEDSRAVTKVSSCWVYQWVCLAGETCASQWRIFYTITGDVKSVQNLVRSPLYTVNSYCLQVTDKRQKVTKVKCKWDESTTKQSLFVEYNWQGIFFFRRNIWVLLRLICRRTQKTIIDQKRYKHEQIYISTKVIM